MKNKYLMNMLIKASEKENIKLTKTLFYNYMQKYRSRIEKKELNTLWESFKLEVIRFYIQNAELDRKLTCSHFNIHESLIRHSIKFYNNLKTRPYGYVAEKIGSSRKRKAIATLNNNEENNINRIESLLKVGYSLEEVLKTLNIEIVCNMPSGNNIYMRERNIN